MFSASLPLSQRDRRLRWGWLGGCSVPFWLAISVWLGWHPSAHPCPFQALLHFPSPTCGLTRSLLAFWRGDWQQSLAYHAFGIPLILLSLGLALHLGLELWLGRSLSGYSRNGRSPQPLFTTYPRWLVNPGSMAIGVVLLFGYYGLRLYARYSAGLLPFQLDQTALWQTVVMGAKWL